MFPSYRNQGMMGTLAVKGLIMMHRRIRRCNFITLLLARKRNSDLKITNKMKSLGETYFSGKESERRTSYAYLGFNELRIFLCK